MQIVRNSRKLFYKIGEVCKICGLRPHVLRYWENEFTVLSPSKNKSGQRIYRWKDLELIETIKKLLYQEGYTIAGAEKKLLENGAPPGEDLPLFRRPLKSSQENAIVQIRQELQEIIGILDDTAGR